MAGVIPEKHKPQMVVQLACTGRQWCEFVAFDPRIRDPRRQLFVRRYEPTAEEIVEYLSWFVREYERVVDQTKKNAQLVLFDADTMLDALRALSVGEECGGVMGEAAARRDAVVRALAMGGTMNIRVVGFKIPEKPSQEDVG